MADTSVKLGEARAPTRSVQDYLDLETRPVPAYLRDNPYRYLGSVDLPVERWIGRDFHDREFAKMWTKVWQVACFEEEIPNAGDYVTYEIGNYSFIVVRQSGGAIKALYNSCLHRATRLASGQGTATNFRCPFHGWVHGIGGRVTGIPCEWDFAHLGEAGRHMPEARVECRHGMVFINLDHDAGSLADYLQGLDPAFERYPLTARYKAAHVRKVVPGNWKIGLEQFIESYHLLATHPEGLPYISDANAQYNTWDENPHLTRMHSLHSVSSPHVEGRYSQQEMMDIITAITDKSNGVDRIVVPEGKTTREILAEVRRESLRDIGIETDHLTDAEMIDTIHYHIFPNTVVWTAYGAPIVYRFRPNGDDHESHVMEVIFMSNCDPRKPKPAPAAITDLGIDQSWTEAAELGKLGWVFDQDVSNAHLVLAGLKASGKKTVTLGNYQEIRIRKYHDTIDTYLNK